jgi:hypothetical protein
MQENSTKYVQTPISYVIAWLSNFVMSNMNLPCELFHKKWSLSEANVI